VLDGLRKGLLLLGVLLKKGLTLGSADAEGSFF